MIRDFEMKVGSFYIGGVTRVAFWLWCAWGLGVFPAPTNGQDHVASIANADTLSDTTNIAQQIKDLSHPSYRTRQLARWRLEQSPLETIDALQACLSDVQFNTGSQLVDILSALATQADANVSSRARQALQQHANRVSAVGRLADNALRAIADLQEEQAIAILSHHGARFGSSNMLGIVLNGKPKQDAEEFALLIDESFTGDAQVVAWIQFLKSVEIVYFEGSQVSPEYFQAISALPNVKKLKCKHVSMSQADLMQLKEFAWLQLLELAYVEIDDSYLSLLGELPISETLRLFGTRITAAGAQKLAQQLDGIEIYCGIGGHLGIATNPKNTTVSEVSANTGAARAGIRAGDELTHVNGVEIKDMSELRAQLAKHGAGDTIRVSLIRYPIPGSNLVEEHTLQVTLTEDPH